MITLDYRTLNPRWGYSGLYFNSWKVIHSPLGIFQTLHITGISLLLDKESFQSTSSLITSKTHGPTKVVFIITAPYKAWRSTSKT